MSQLDTALFYWINLEYQSFMMTTFMKFITESRNFIIPGALTAIFLVWRYHWQGFWFVALTTMAVIINDAVCYQILKPLFNRPRPCMELMDAIVYGRCSNNGSFPSNHASNIFTLATLFSGVYKKTTLFAFTIACLVGISRIYLGVHYPLDVFGGAFIGISVGCTGVHFYRKLSIPK